jgi:hypothetical protein
MIHSVHLVIERNGQYISQSLLLIHNSMNTMITLPIVLKKDVTEIMAYATDTTQSGNRSGSGNQSSDCIPYSEWIQIPEEQRNKILAKRKQERLENARCSQTSHPTTRRANTHNVETYIDLDSIIDNTILYEEAEPNNDNDVPPGTTEGNSDLLAYMAGQQSSSGDICQVLAAKQAPD